MTNHQSYFYAAKKNAPKIIWTKMVSSRGKRNDSNKSLASRRHKNVHQKKNQFQSAIHLITERQKSKSTMKTSRTNEQEKKIEIAVEQQQKRCLNEAQLTNCHQINLHPIAESNELSAFSLRSVSFLFSRFNGNRQTKIHYVISIFATRNMKINEQNARASHAKITIYEMHLCKQCAHSTECGRSVFFPSFLWLVHARAHSVFLFLFYVCQMKTVGRRMCTKNEKKRFDRKRTQAHENWRFCRVTKSKSKVKIHIRFTCSVRHRYWLTDYGHKTFIFFLGCRIDVYCFTFEMVLLGRGARLRACSSTIIWREHKFTFWWHGVNRFGFSCKHFFASINFTASLKLLNCICQKANKSKRVVCFT